MPLPNRVERLPQTLPLGSGETQTLYVVYYLNRKIKQVFKWEGHAERHLEMLTLHERIPEWE
jgi:hypothetical protein